MNIITNEGIHTHTNSLLSICMPLSLKNFVTLIGETLITFHGKKYRSFQKGAKKATPLPPVVKASKTPCDAVQAKNVRYSANHAFEKGFSER